MNCNKWPYRSKTPPPLMPGRVWFEYNNWYPLLIKILVFATTSPLVKRRTLIGTDVDDNGYPDTYKFHLIVNLMLASKA